MSESFNLGQLFKIPYETLMGLVYSFSKDLHISFDNFMNMYWFEILMIIEKHNEFVEEQKSESSGQNDIFAEQQARMENMYKQQQQNMPKFESPSMPDFSNYSNFKI